MTKPTARRRDDPEIIAPAGLRTITIGAGSSSSRNLLVTDAAVAQHLQAFVPGSAGAPVRVSTASKARACGHFVDVEAGAKLTVPGHLGSVRLNNLDAGAGVDVGLAVAWDGDAEVPSPAEITTPWTGNGSVPWTRSAEYNGTTDSHVGTVDALTGSWTFAVWVRVLADGSVDGTEPVTLAALYVAGSVNGVGILQTTDGLGGILIDAYANDSVNGGNYVGPVAPADPLAWNLVVLQYDAAVGEVTLAVVGGGPPTTLALVFTDTPSAVRFGGPRVSDGSYDDLSSGALFDGRIGRAWLVRRAALADVVNYIGTLPRAEVEARDRWEFGDGDYTGQAPPDLGGAVYNRGSAGYGAGAWLSATGAPTLVWDAP